VARLSKKQRLHVSMNGEHVGYWDATPNKPQEFTYAASWTASKEARPISLSLPISAPEARYSGPVVERFFENLLPDSRAIRLRIRQHVGAASEGAFDLLAKIGRDCAGALQITTEAPAVKATRQINATPITDKAIEELLVKTAGATILGRPEEEDEDFRISLAGAQEKTALLRLENRWMRPHGATPSTHILKLPIGQLPQGIDLGTSVENEWLCAEIVKAYGFATANCEMAVFGRQKALIVERFDRRLSRNKKWIMRLPQEDLAQATGTDREHKYQADGGPGIEQIMGILLGAAEPERDRLDFFRSQIAFWMLCAIDGHAKNFSIFLEAGGQYRLTPRYDVLSAFPVLGKKPGQLAHQKIKMAMAVQSDARRHYRWSEICRRHFEGTAKRCGIGAQVDALFEDLIARTPTVIATVGAGLPKGFPSSVSEPIFKGLETSAGVLAMK
jgi:serine/threonine-protein kinase HipA